MTKEEAIKYLRQLYPYGGHCWLDEQRTEAIGMAVKALQEEPVSGVWHKKDEEPCEDRQVLVCLSGNYYVDFYHKKDKRFYMCLNPHHYLCEVDRWAYIDDIIKRSNVQRTVKNWKKEPVSKDLEVASKEWLSSQLDKSYANYGEAKMMELTHFDGYAMLDAIEFGANWQKAKDQHTIELAEDHAYFAGRTKTIDEIKEKLLSEVLPCFMHGGEADEVVAKLDEVLNQKK